VIVQEVVHGALRPCFFTQRLDLGSWEDRAGLLDVRFLQHLLHRSLHLGAVSEDLRAVYLDGIFLKLEREYVGFLGTVLGETEVAVAS